MIHGSAVYGIWYVKCICSRVVAFVFIHKSSNRHICEESEGEGDES